MTQTNRSESIILITWHKLTDHINSERSWCPRPKTHHILHGWQHQQRRVSNFVFCAVFNPAKWCCWVCTLLSALWWVALILLIRAKTAVLSATRAYLKISIHFYFLFTVSLKLIIIHFLKKINYNLRIQILFYGVYVSFVPYCIAEICS